MRISKKKELINCIDTLKKGNNKVLKIDSRSRMDFLTQCQGMAIMVGTEIDRIEGEGVVTVSYLEQYCEEIYQMSVTADRGELIQEQKRVQGLLLQIKESIQNDIPDSPAEIVFLPYKASMWDALDSVYRAATQEKKCNVTVMPIPYYNINPKGEILSVEYEGNLFPADISITDFRKVNLEQLHPDIIFIHNPYDEWNKVTQVPNEFFSSTLIHQTEHLIYIPYFVTTGEKIKDDYCYLPAVRNAWRTFVQSDAVRNCYIKNGADPHKIVAMGSPKFDMVIQKQKNLPTMPEKWHRALDGRKIFLLNTHLNPIINNAKKTMDKLQKIFLLFKERDDVALLWRPHPLSIQTAKSMNPEMLNQYLQLVDEFKNLPNGVYDDTADVHRAIAFSDAYIGDWSSLVSLYGITGKPIFITDIHIESNIRISEKDTCLSFASGAWQENTIWTVDERHNGLYRVNLIKNCAEFITCFEKENLFSEALYHRVVLYKNKIYLIPWKAEQIAIYNIETNELKYLALDCKMPKGLYKFSESIQYKNYLFLFPAHTSVIIRIDLQNDTINYYLLEALERLKTVKANYSILLSGGYYGDTAWVASRRDACMLEFNMDNCQGVLHYMKYYKAELVDVACNENEVFALNVNGEVLLWNKAANEEKIVWKYNGDVEVAPFYRIVRINNYLYLLPGKESKVVKIDISKNYETKEIFFPDGYCTKNIGITKFYDYVKQNEKIIIYPGNMKILVEIDSKEDLIKVKKIKLVDWELYDRRTLYQVESEVAKNKQHLYLYKENICPLEYFVNSVLEEKEMYSKQRGKVFRMMQCHSDGTCGQKIWDYINGQIII